MKDIPTLSYIEGNNSEPDPYYSTTSTEPIIIVLNTQLVVTELNEAAATEFFSQKKTEVLNHSFLKLLSDQEINEKEILAQIEHSKHALFHCSKLYQPRTKKDYELTIICIHLEEKISYVLVLKNINKIHPKDTLNSKDKKSLNKQPSSKMNKVLLVEDYPIAARIAKTILLELGCEVDIAETGEAALQVVEQKHYDLIFMDIGLPDIDGCAVTEQIRSHSLKRLAQTPIVALTAHGESTEKQYCLDVGMNMVITKPISKKWAKTVLDNLIHQREKQKRQIKQVKQAAHADAGRKLVEKIIDIEYAKALLGGNEAMVQEILMVFVDSLSEEVKTLKQSYQQKDWKKLKSLAHKLKGGSSYCGALRLKSVCADLESHIKPGGLITPKIPALYQRVLAEIEAIQRFMNDQPFD